MIVDDHPLVRHALAELLEREENLAVCVEAGGMGEALKSLETQTLDLALVDVSLPDGDGLELVRRMKTCRPGMQILVVSMHDEIHHAALALEAGAAGYISKHQPPEEIMAAVYRLLEGEIYVKETLFDRIRSRRGEDAVRKIQEGLQALAEGERRHLSLLGRGLTTKRIAEELGLEEPAVRRNQVGIRERLGLRDVLELRSFARAMEIESDSP